MNSNAEHYIIQKELGSGGFATTWLAQDTRQGAESGLCVMKKVHLDKLDQWKTLELFERECKTLKHLNHSGIPRFLDAWVSADPAEAVLVQHYVEGKNLQQWLSEGRRFTEAESIDLALQLCEILTYLHSFSPPVVHRDIKPSNLILDQANRLYLIDFGAVSLTLSTSQQSISYTGTLGYMPIEQFEGKALPASDLYALGATWVALLTGQSPSEIPKKNLKPDFRSQTRLSQGLCQILDRLLEPDITHRYQEATELAADLRLLKQKQQTSAKSLPQESLWRQTVRFMSLLQIPPQWRIWLGVFGVLVFCVAMFKILSPSKQASHPQQPIQNQTVQHQAQSQMLTWQKAVLPWQKLDPAPQILHLSEASDGTVWGISSNAVFAFKNNTSQKWNSRDLTGQYASLQWLNADLDGEIWFGTYDSQLYRWEGLQTAKRPQAVSLPCAGKLNALGSWQNKLLLGCNNELFAWNRSKKLFELIGGFNGPVSLIQSESAENLLVSVKHQLYTYDSLKWKLLWQGKNAYDDQIRQIVSTPERIYLGLEKSAIELDRKRQTSAVLLNNAKITGMSVQANKAVWIATTDTYSEGLYLLEPGSREISHLGWREGLPSDRFQALLLDRQNNLWLAADYSGQGELIKAPIQEVQKAIKAPARNHLSARRFANACLAWQGIQPANNTHLAGGTYGDQVHVFWHQQLVCPYGEGFRRSDGSVLLQRFRELDTWQKGQIQKHVLPNNVFSSNSQLWDQSGAIWLARSWPNDLLIKSNKGNWLTQSTSDGLSTEKPALLYQTRQGQILVASRVKAQLPLQIYDAKTRHWQASGLMGTDDYIEAKQILELKSGELALATDKGLYLISANFKEARRLEGLLYSDIQTIAEDLDGNLWIAFNPYGSGRGLSRWDVQSGKIQHLDSRHGLVPDRFQDLAIDSKNNLWLMEAASRVNVYTRESIQNALASK